MKTATDALLTYSMVKALYDQGRDYIDSFWPFVLQVLPLDCSPLPVPAIADNLSTKYGLRVPLHTLRTFAERARKKYSLLSLTRSDVYALTPAGLEFVMRGETERDVQRRIQAFVLAVQEFLLKKYALNVDENDVRAIVERVVERNVELFDFLVDKPAQSALPGDGPVTAERAVLEFFADVEQSDPDAFATLRDLICGSVISTLLRRTDIADATRHFDRTTLYLDSNVLLSVLELRFPEQSRPTRELLELIADAGYFELAVLDITLEETTELLRGYEREYGNYVADIPVDSIFASMRARRLSRGDVTELIRDLPNRLAGLRIGRVRTGLTLDGIADVDASLLQGLAKFKPEQPRRGQIHDLAVIEYVQKRRRGEFTRVEHAKFFLLTEDVRLSNYAYLERGHKAHETVSEVMPDRLLTNLLWLKRPTTLKRLPLPAIIAMHSRDLLISRPVWTRFHETIRALEHAKTIDPDGASALLYDAQVQKDLALLGAHRADEVRPDWVLERVTAARKRRDAESKDAAERMQGEFEGRIRERELEVRREARATIMSRQDELEATVAASKRKFSAAAQRAAYATVLVCRTITAFGVGLVTIEVGPVIIAQWDSWEPAAYVVGMFAVFGAPFLGIRADIHGLVRSAERRLRDKLYARKLIEIAPIIKLLEEQRSKCAQAAKEAGRDSD